MKNDDYLWIHAIDQGWPDPLLTEALLMHSILMLIWEKGNGWW